MQSFTQQIHPETWCKPDSVPGTEGVVVKETQVVNKADLLTELTPHNGAQSHQ